MSHSSKFSIESSSSDVCRSDSSESCKSSLPEEKCKTYCPEELLSKLGNAVVKINSTFILVGVNNAVAGEVTTTTPMVVNDTTALSPPTLAAGSTTVFTGGRQDTILASNGFFIIGQYILCPASAVILPPTLTAAVNRYPYLNAIGTDIALGQYKDQMVRASRILVTVFDVNGSGKSFVYEATLVGVDGAGDIAVLKINPNSNYNRRNPCVNPKVHPFLHFGNSKELKDGERVYMIGDYLANIPLRNQGTAIVPSSGENLGIVEGLVAHNAHADHSGFSLQEQVLVSANIGLGARGMPILNKHGKFVAMQTLNPSSLTKSPVILGDTYELSLAKAGGPSAYFMQDPVKHIIGGFCNQDARTEKNCDQLGAYVRYLKGYAGIASDVFEGYMYDVTSDYTSVGNVAPRTRLDANGDLTDSPSCKEIIGVRVLGLAGANPEAASTVGINNGYYYVPGGTSTLFKDSLLPSPFLGRLNAGDIITHIDGYSLGDLGKQIAPALFTWKTSGGETLNLAIRKGGAANNTVDPAVVGVAESNAGADYENQRQVSACLNDFPAFMDYPWYSIMSFPSYEAFFLAYAPALLNSAQLPGPEESHFRPAW